MSRSNNISAAHNYSLTSANVCLLPEFAARYDNLPDVIERSKKIGQYFSSENNTFSEHLASSQISDKEIGFVRSTTDGGQFLAMSNSPSLHTIDTDSSHNYGKLYTILDILFKVLYFLFSCIKSCLDELVDLHAINIIYYFKYCRNIDFTF